MYKRKNCLAATVCILLLLPLFQSCHAPKQDAQPEVRHVNLDTTVYIKPGTASPHCDIGLYYAYLKPASDNDSVSLSINTKLQKEISGNNRLSQLSPEKFVQATVEKYIKNYQEQIGNLYEADLRNGVSPEDIPAWYNHEHSINTTLERGKADIWNYTITVSRYEGGAHPNTFSKLLNIDSKTGKVLVKEDVFQEKSEQNICRLILEQLIQEANRRLSTDTIQSIEGLQENGLLLNTDLYVPDNFLLKKDGVTFLYNRYDIAPYSFGDFFLTIPYKQISGYMKIFSTDITK